MLMWIKFHVNHAEHTLFLLCCRGGLLTKAMVGGVTNKPKEQIVGILRVHIYWEIKHGTQSNIYTFPSCIAYEIGRLSSIKCFNAYRIVYGESIEVCFMYQSCF